MSLENPPLKLQTEFTDVCILARKNVNVHKKIQLAKQHLLLLAAFLCLSINKAKCSKHNTTGTKPSCNEYDNIAITTIDGQQIKRAKEKTTRPPIQIALGSLTDWVVGRNCDCRLFRK